MMYFAIPGGDKGDTAGIEGTFSTILRYDAIKDDWELAAQMREKKKGHAVAVVDRDIVKHRCY